MLTASVTPPTLTSARKWLRFSLNSFFVFCIASTAQACAGLIWGGVFMFRQPKGATLGSEYITNEGAALSFFILLLLQCLLTAWYLLVFLKSDRLSLIGMYAIALPLLLFTFYVTPPPLNLLAYFSIQFSFITALACWFENDQNERLRLREQEESL